MAKVKHECPFEQWVVFNNSCPYFIPKDNRCKDVYDSPGNLNAWCTNAILKFYKMKEIMLEEDT